MAQPRRKQSKAPQTRAKTGTEAKVKTKGKAGAGDSGSGKKLRIAFYDFTSCEGCQLQVLNCEDELLDILKKVDIVQFREAIDDRQDACDVAFIEGAFSRESDRSRLEQIRRNAKFVVALGACATTGGLNVLKNFRGIEKAMKTVYGKQAHLYETSAVQPIEAIIKVDYKVHGCPIPKGEFLEVLTSLVAGRQPQIPDYPVCVECKLRENVCLYHKGQYCMGVVARAGCTAWCPSYGGRCYACRGLISDPNNKAAKDVLEEFGLTLEQVLDEFRLFNGVFDVAKE
ncbi:MAG: NADH:ubiquinone oxidoreductase [Phycisphaerae bacterium]|jgi:coenzyme F420-reducing hydrogenase gamma subunit